MPTGDACLRQMATFTRTVTILHTSPIRLNDAAETSVRQRKPV